MKKTIIMVFIGMVLGVNGIFSQNSHEPALEEFQKHFKKD